MTVFNDLAVIILAAGKGTRMKSDLAKVLHPVAGKSMVNHVIEASSNVSPNHIHVVIGHQADKVRQEIQPFFTVNYAIQTQLLGTGDAVKSALPGLDPSVKDVLVLCGDVPLIQTDTLITLVNGHQSHQADVTVLATQVDHPTGYGRILTDDGGQVICIKEEADATPEEKQVDIINTGIYCFNREFLNAAIPKIVPDNNQAEYYLTDLVEIANRNGQKVVSITMEDPGQVMGVNTLEELERANVLIDVNAK